MTQHAITTQHITFKPDGPMAVVTSYFTGIHFGQGRWKGKEVTAWRKYQDIMVSEREGDDWKIAKREVSFMGRLGEEGVMDGE